MRHYITTTALVLGLLAMVLVQGCGPTPEEAAAGTYVLDTENIKKAAQAEIDAEADESAKSQMQMAMAMIEQMSMTVTLKADGTASSSMSMMGQSQNATGTWKISGDQVTIAMAAPGEEPDPATGTLKGETLELVPPKDGDMPFNLVFKKQAK